MIALTRTRTLAAAVLAAATASVVLLPTTSAEAGHRAAVVSGDLDGRQEVGGEANRRLVGDPNGSGEAYLFSPRAGELCYVLEVADVETPRAAHVHEAPAGSNGPVVVTLGAPIEGESAGCVTGLDDGLIADILVRETANYYVNIHNDEHPAGALRGQLS